MQTGGCSTARTTNALGRRDGLRRGAAPAPNRLAGACKRGGAVAARQAHNLEAVGSIPTPATAIARNAIVFFVIATTLLVSLALLGGPR